MSRAQVSVVELGTRAEVAMALKHCRAGERAMVAPLLRHLTPEMLLLLDQGFYSYKLWRQLDRTGVKLLARVTSKLVLRSIQALSDGSYLAKIYPNDHARAKDRDGIVVRVTRYTIDDPQRVGHGQTHVMLTNLLDEVQYPTEELICLYHERWEEETTFDEQKSHHDPTRITKPTHLRSKRLSGKPGSV